jgi:uridine kinase
VLVAVDGVDGSGKTTFAAAFAAALRDRGRPVHVVHLDDFPSPRAVRYRLGRSLPQGYFRDTYDLAAFTTSVLDPLQAGGDRAIVPRAFDHRTETPVHADPVPVPEQAVVIIEGMFLHRDELAGRRDMSVFLQVPFTVTARRMAHRDGTHPDPEHPSLARYVQGQRLYLPTCDPTKRATYVLDNS